MREHTADTYRVHPGEESEGRASQYNTPRGYNQGGRGGFIGHKRGGFDRGRGPIICYNCNQPRHLARDCLNLYTTCKYCRQLDHTMEDFPQLIAKRKEKRNLNVQMIAAEVCDQQPKIATVTHRGTRTRADVAN